MARRYRSIYPTAIQLETHRRRLVEELALRDASDAPPRRARVRRATRRLLGLAGSEG